MPRKLFVRTDFDHVVTFIENSDTSVNGVDINPEYAEEVAKISDELKGKGLEFYRIAFSHGKFSSFIWNA